MLASREFQTICSATWNVCLLTSFRVNGTTKHGANKRLVVVTVVGRTGLDESLSCDHTVYVAIRLHDTDATLRQTICLCQRAVCAH